MLDLLFVALFQAAAGDPAPASEQDLPAATENVESTEAAPANEEQEPEVHRRCWTEQVTGTRFGRRVCETRDQRVERERETREMMHNMQMTSPGPPSG